MWISLILLSCNGKTENQMSKVTLKLTCLVKNELIYNHKMPLNIYCTSLQRQQYRIPLLLTLLKLTYGSQKWQYLHGRILIGRWTTFVVFFFLTFQRLQHKGWQFWNLNKTPNLVTSIQCYIVRQMCSKWEKHQQNNWEWLTTNKFTWMCANKLVSPTVTATIKIPNNPTCPGIHLPDHFNLQRNSYFCIWSLSYMPLLFLLKSVGMQIIKRNKLNN